MDISQVQSAAKHISKSKKKKWHVFKANFELLVFTLPVLFYFFIFHYLPMGGLVLAFKDYRYDRGIFGSDWVGFQNFDFFFTSQDAWRITRNTVSYSAVFIVTGIISALIISLLLYEVKSRLATKIYQTTMILPHFLSWVIVGYISYILLNPVHGVLNQILVALGRSPVQWYTEKQYWPFILTFSNIWKSIGLSTIIYYAALMGIDSTLFEAAEIDGATKLRQVWHISIPSITPLMSILALLSIAGLFRGDFGLFYQIPRNVGVLYSVTDIIDTYVYRGLRQGHIGMTTAVGLFQSVFGLIMVLISNWIVRRVKNENALF